MQELMRRFVGQPGRAFFSGNSQKNDVRLSEMNMNAGRRILPIWKFIVLRSSHTLKINWKRKIGSLKFRLARTLAPPNQPPANFHAG